MQVFPEVQLVNHFIVLSPARRGLLTVLCLTLLSVAAFAQGVRSVTGTCSNCKKEVSWTEGARALAGGSQGPPKSCPHCGVKFEYAEFADGTKKRGMSGFSPPFSSNSGDSGPVSNFAILGVLCILVLVGGVAGLIALGVSMTNKTKRRKNRRPQRMIDDDDDDFEDDDRPRRKRRR